MSSVRGPAEPLPWRSVTIVGLGALGGSVAKAVLRHAPEAAVFGLDIDDASASAAAADGVSILNGLADADPTDGVYVFATPLDVTLDLLPSSRDVWQKATLAMDVASLKGPVMEAALRCGPGPFVGCHPMCGTEKSGYAAARSDLFHGARVWLCRPPEGNVHVEAAGHFWALLGGRPAAVSAERHDDRMVWTSHLPQLVSNALARALDEAGIEPGDLGPGGAGMTRLAGSGPSMWLPLLEAAADADAGALVALELQVRRIREMLENKDMEALDHMMLRDRAWAGRES